MLILLMGMHDFRAVNRQQVAAQLDSIRGEGLYGVPVAYALDGRDKAVRGGCLVRSQRDGHEVNSHRIRAVVELASIQGSYLVAGDMAIMLGLRREQDPTRLKP
jgi:hypothetical protein